MKKSKIEAIDELLGDAGAGEESSATYVWMPLDSFVDRPDNRAIDPVYVEELAASIDKDGMADAVLARTIEGMPSKCELVAGQHRRAAVKLNAERMPGDPRWSGIETKLVRGMDDRRARRLMLATNIHNPNVPEEEMGMMLSELMGDAVRLRAEHPDELRGVPTATIVSEMVRSATGKPMSPATVNRRLRARADAEAARRRDGELIGLWRDEFGARRYPAKIRAAAAALDEEAQRRVFEGFEDHERSREWLERQLDIEAGRSSLVAARAAAAIQKGLGTLLYLSQQGADVSAAVAEIELVLDRIHETGGC